MRNLVLIPTYNERENVSAMVDKVFSLPVEFDILVIDDGSPDGTADIVRERQKDYPDRLHLLCREGKLGLGTAYLAGFRWGLERDYDYIIEMDAVVSGIDRHRYGAELSAQVALSRLLHVLPRSAVVRTRAVSTR